MRIFGARVVDCPSGPGAGVPSDETAVYLTRLADICRAAGLDVVEVRGWKRRGHGPMTAVKTIVCHHTAGPKKGNMPSLNVITNGRPGLSGPLSQLGLGRDGTVYVIAAGLAYHAGQVRSSSYANAYAIGIEAEATGVDPWPAVQMDAYGELCAALVRAYDLTVSRVLGHKEVCYPVGRKSDPNFSMPDFRARVTKVLKAPATVPVGTPAQIFSAVWARDAVKGSWMTPDNPTWAAQSVVVTTFKDQVKAADAAKAATRALPAAAADARATTAAATTLRGAAAALGATATPAAADAAQTRAAADRSEATLAALQASVRTSMAEAVKAAVETSRVRVHVTVRSRSAAAVPPATNPSSATGSAPHPR